MTITADDLKVIMEAQNKAIAAAVAAAITESRKPNPPTEQEVAQLKLAQAHREATANDVIATAQNKLNLQMICTHTHAQRDGGGTHCVWVKEEDPRSAGFILCQLNHCRIRPGTFDKEGLPYQRDRGAIYDTDKFNKLFQDCGPSGLMG